MDGMVRHDDDATRPPPPTAARICGSVSTDLTLQLKMKQKTRRSISDILNFLHCMWIYTICSVDHLVVLGQKVMAYDVPPPAQVKVEVASS